MAVQFEEDVTLENIDINLEDLPPQNTHRSHATTILRAAAYPRCSDPNLEDSKTLESQEKDIWRFVARNKQYRLVKERVYAEAITGYMRPFREREVFSRVLAAAKRGEFDVLLVTEFSRLSRRQIEQAVIIYILEQYGVKVVSITEQIEDTPLGHFMRAVYAFVAELEREKTYYRTQRGKRDRIEDGNLTGQGFPRYGLTWVDTKEYKKAKYIINDEIIFVGEDNRQWREIDVVMYMFEAAYKGVTEYQIALTLTSMGVPTRTGRKQFWQQQTVHQILTDEVYTGVTYVNKYGKKDGKVYDKPRSEWIRLPNGTSPMIIDPLFFQDVQERLKLNKKDASRNSKEKPLALLRAGHAICGVCGQRMYITNAHESKHKRGGKVYIYQQKPAYSCQESKGVDDLKYHHRISILLEQLDREAWVWTSEFLQDPRLVRERVAQVRKDLTQETYLHETQETLDEVKRQIRNLTRLGATAQSDEELDEIDGLLAQLNERKRQAETFLQEAQDLEDFNARLNSELDHFELWAYNLDSRIQAGEQLDYLEMRRAIVILGVEAIIYPASEPERVQLRLGPSRIVTLISRSL